MKSLHISYKYGIRYVGGAVAASSRLHIAMLVHGDDSRVVCVWNNFLADPIGDSRSHGVLCLRAWWWWMGVRGLHFLTRKWTHWLDLPGFDRLVHEWQPDEVHVHWIRRDTVSWRQLKRLGEWAECRGVPLYVHLHDLWPLDQQVIVELKPTFVAYSDWVARVVRERGWRVERRELILDPAFACEAQDKRPNVSRRREQEDENGRGRQALRVLFGCKDGRRNPDKGFEDLDAALGLLPPEVKQRIELRIFGEGDETGQGAAQTLANGVRMVLLGRIDDPLRLKDEYLNAGCFAFPSKHETMGMTKLEALACGCKVVAFNREACAERIEHLKTGYVAKDGDITDYAHGLLWALGLEGERIVLS